MSVSIMKTKTVEMLSAFYFFPRLKIRIYERISVKQKYEVLGKYVKWKLSTHGHESVNSHSL
jgi:hypothetical protein